MHLGAATGAIKYFLGLLGITPICADDTKKKEALLPPFSSYDFNFVWLFFAPPFEDFNAFVFCP